MIGTVRAAGTRAGSGFSRQAETLVKLRQGFAIASRKGWRGFDPYDGLLSPIARLPVVGRSRSFRLALTQVVKRSPVNLRPLLGIKEGLNPKALALLLSAAARTGDGSELRPYVQPLAAALEEAQSAFHPGMSWGYNFPWQGRSFYLPAGTPTVVVTSFAGEAFLDAHAATGVGRYLENAQESCDFVLRGLNRTQESTGTCLSYSPLDRSVVYNASLLGARLLVLTGQRAGREDLIREASPLVAYALAKQRPDGAWMYGEARNQQWIDSFHTGFILRALNAYRRITNDAKTGEAIRKGGAFYSSRFFGSAGEPYFKLGKKYPLDIHSAAEGILAFLELRDVEATCESQAAAVGRWMIRNLLDEHGLFHYQVRRTYLAKIPFMRWSQAWGIRALAELVRCGIEL